MAQADKDHDLINYAALLCVGLTGSFSLSLAESSLDWDGVWSGVFGSECLLVASSAIVFFCFF